MRKLLFTFVVVLLSITANAQNMLGASYEEVKETYKSYKSTLTGWQEGINKEGIPYITYNHKNYDYAMLVLFENGYVSKYIIMDTENKANDYVKKFNENFVQIDTHTWIDYSADCTWHILLEDGMVICEALPVEKD
jgi:hypothetical protein